MNQQLSSAAQLEAYLFYEGGEAKKSAVTKTLSWTREQLNQAIADLTTVLTDRGITLVHTEDTVALKTAPACASFVYDQNFYFGSIGIYTSPVNEIPLCL
jgi:chromosome segregation and condensation protein ScpB